jgi:hypothetical protein
MGHTPGPWYANQDCIEIDGPEGPRDVTLAVVLQADNAAADARLIAAAPELLAALKELVAYDDGSNEPEDYGYELLQRCKAAIAKAEGRSE